VPEYKAIITPKGVAYMPIKLNLWYTTDTPDQSIVSKDSLQYVFPQLTAVVLATSIGTLIIDERNHVKAMRCRAALVFLVNDCKGRMTARNRSPLIHTAEKIETLTEVS